MAITIALVRRSVMPVLCAIMGSPGCCVVDRMIAFHWPGIAAWACDPETSAIICELRPGPASKAYNFDAAKKCVAVDNLNVTL